MEIKHIGIEIIVNSLIFLGFFTLLNRKHLNGLFKFVGYYFQSNALFEILLQFIFSTALLEYEDIIIFQYFSNALALVFSGLFLHHVLENNTAKVVLKYSIILGLIITFAGGAWLRFKDFPNWMVSLAHFIIIPASLYIFREFAVKTRIKDTDFTPKLFFVSYFFLISMLNTLYQFFKDSPMFTNDTIQIRMFFVNAGLGFLLDVTVLVGIYKFHKSPNRRFFWFYALISAILTGLVWLFFDYFL